MKQKIVITGASGFLGRAVLKLLSQNKDVEILAISRQTEEKSQENVHFVSIDLRDFENINKAICNFNPDGLIHLAWMGVFNSSHMDENQFENVSILQNLLESLSMTSCQYVVGLGSQAEYGQYEIPIKESFQANPKTCYGKAKLKASNLVLDFCEEKAIRAVWLRLFASFGPNDHPNWLISYVIRSFLINETPKLTSGDQKCDYLYVYDAAEAIIQSCFSPIQGIYNLGSGTAQSVKNIVKAIYSEIRPTCSLEFGQKHLNQTPRKLLQADITKISQGLKWKPTFQLKEALTETIERYKASQPQK